AKSAVVAGAATAAVAAAASSSKPPAPHTAEARLLHVLELVKREVLDAALRAAAQLTIDVPHFRVAHLAHADLLRYKTATATGWAHAPASEITQLLAKNAAGTPAAPAPAHALQEQVEGLQKELQRRVQAYGLLPPAGSVPREFQLLGASVRHAVAIDASKSR